MSPCPSFRSGFFVRASGMIALLLGATGLAGRLRASEPAAPDAAPPAHVRIVLVGDSTVTDGSGWGRGFRRFLTADAECLNHAANGRSSKSYLDEGRLAPALAAHGDYYLIQFGHNDQPGKGPSRETDPATTYRENLAHMIDEVRALGAEPILVTSLVRRTFDPAAPDHLVSTLGPYVEAAKHVGAEKHVPVLDLHTRSLALCEQLGPGEVATLNPVKDGKPDTTHLGPEGSLVFARLVVEELRCAVPALARVLREEPAPLPEDLPVGEVAGLESAEKPR